MKKETLKREISGIVLSMFVGLFGVSAVAEENQIKEKESQKVSLEINKK